jgi:hypothetical protein
MPKQKSAPIKPTNHNFQVGPVRISPILVLILFLFLISLYFLAGLTPIVPGIVGILAGLLLVADGVRNGLALKTLGFPALGVFLIVYGIALTFNIAMPTVVVGALALIAAVLLFLGVKRRQSNIFSMFTLIFWLAIMGILYLFPPMLGAPNIGVILGLLPILVILLIFARK